MRRIKQIAWQMILLLSIGALLGLTINAVSNDPLPLKRPPKPVGEWPILNAEEVFERIEEGLGLVIDAREEKEFKLGHLPGALNLPAITFGETFEEIGGSLPLDLPLIVYCQGGACDESDTVLRHLKTLEFENLSQYIGGWLDWKEKEYPTETEEEAE